MSQSPSQEMLCLFSEASEHNSMIWQRLGHANIKNLKRVEKAMMVSDFLVNDFVSLEKYVACALGKHHKKPHKLKVYDRVDSALELLHMGLFGPVNVESIQHHDYCVVITDYSHISWVFFLKS